ncbi:hypothetical protein KKH15_02185 [Patescibacteria group bacterium]|nr:hypothetical protein [Patescibacteria group bacterium]MBU0801128.1 hypothetical protein [Alphaproteobacteria bacterium]MBU1754859.1 hypothetical protein [Patescibacteria group bacterium]
MNNTTIADKVLEKIETTEPHSKEYFMLRTIGMWSLASASIVVGGLAISSILFRTMNAGMVMRPGIPPLPTVVALIPFLWIVLVTVFGYFAYKEIRATPKGYKYEWHTLLISVLLASCVFGIAFYVTGAGFMLDRFAGKYVPFHPGLEQIQHDRWLQPERGFLEGVLGEDTETGIRITDSDDVMWEVLLAESLAEERLELLEKGQRVGIRGRLLDADAHTFVACDIRSLEFEGRGMQMTPPMRGERKLPPPRTTTCEDVRPLITN